MIELSPREIGKQKRRQKRHFDFRHKYFLHGSRYKKLKVKNRPKLPVGEAIEDLPCHGTMIPHAVAYCIPTSVRVNFQSIWRYFEKHKNLPPEQMLSRICAMAKRPKHRQAIVSMFNFWNCIKEFA